MTIAGEYNPDPNPNPNPKAGEYKIFGLSVASIKIRTSESGGDDEKVSAFVPTLFRLGAKKGYSYRVARMHAGGRKPSISRLKPDGVFFVDDGFQVQIWCGKEAPFALKAGAFLAVQGYLKRYKRPGVLPVTKHNEGNEPADLKARFGPPQEDACCVIS